MTKIKKSESNIDKKVCVYKDGIVQRCYSWKDHGEAYLKNAEAYAGKIGGKIV